jgi:hypothetical protein
MKIKLDGGKINVRFLFILLLIIAAFFGVSSKLRAEGFHQTSKGIESDVNALLSLPYLSYVENDPNPEKKGVTIYNENLSYPGVNLFISRYDRGAYLIDMEGKIVHTWLPEEKLSEKWVISKIDDEGNLIVLVNFLGLVKMDWDSNIIWISNTSENPYLNLKSKYPVFIEEIMNGFHHDFDLAENGDIYVIAGQERIINHSSREIPILDNNIIILDSEGVPKRKISIFDHFGKLIPQKWLDEIALKLNQGEELHHLKEVDVFHSNTIEEVTRDIAVAKKGDILFCVRNLDLIGIIDINTGELIWSWGPGVLDWPHHPTILENGNLLVFDNGPTRNYSRILEIDPTTGDIIWKYEANPKESFFAKIRGSAQRMPNGNTLITDSNNGHVFEVTKEGEIVWEFWNPDFDKKGRRKVIYRMMRLEQSFLDILVEEEV